jgi:ketosteroid isomerase-like protein
MVPSGTTTTAVQTSSVDALKAALVTAVERGDAELAASLYAPDAWLRPPGAPVITGREAVLDCWRFATDTWSSDGDRPLDVAVGEERS